jgi:hypothetical protein
LEAEPDVGVGVGGDGDVGVTEQLLDHHQVYALVQQERSARVPQVVEADRAQVRTLEQGFEVAADVGRVDLIRS